jgi:hypothetical protein
VQQTAALYNGAFLDTSGIGILDPASDSAFNPLVHGRLIQGNYTALLMAGFIDFIPTDTTIAQTGLVPTGTQSLLFKGYANNVFSNNFGVTLGGQALSLTALQNGPNYTLYGADIHAWAGQLAELKFTVFAERPHVSNEYVFLDSIQLSDLVVPEPSALGFFMLSALLFGGRYLSKRT